MSVYTPVEQNELENFLTHYDLDELESFQGISAGIENTNYFVTTSKQSLVLTLFESLSANELPYFLELMAFLAEHAIPSAHPIADRQGQYLRTLNNKPAALVKRLTGTSIMEPNAAQCQAIGKALGMMHTAVKNFSAVRENTRGPHWWHETLKALTPRIDSEDLQLLQEELVFQADARHTELPRGVIHADLFRDNALFDGDTLTGVIDFYYACNDVLLYDIAVTLNDWCSQTNGALDEQKSRALLRAYQSERPLLEAERAAWPVLLRAAALRFWLSRLYDLHFPREGEITHTKDPDAFKHILLQRKAQAAHLADLWD